MRNPICGPRDGENTALHVIGAFAAAAARVWVRKEPGDKGREIAQKIINQGGDYLLAVKDDQRILARAMREFFPEGDGRVGYFAAMVILQD